MKRLKLLLTLNFIPLFVFSQAPATEIRAVWLTTNWGLDWPMQGVSASAQKEQLINILDQLQKANFNVVLFQAREQGYTLYKSKIEPLSPYFNHEDDFDPLAFALEECHKRGMECHAWITTYPMNKIKYEYTGKGSKRKAVPINNKPAYYKQVNDVWYLDPGMPETRKLIISIVKEITENYDVDGINFDYVRYPDSRHFPDNDSYRKYGNGMNIRDWRRKNVNILITEAYDTIKSIKKWVQVSSSPLGRYKVLPDVNTNDGWTAYETVFQDAGYWMKSGKHDLLFPMMYYNEHNFYPFLNDWIANSNGRPIVPGLGVFQMDEQNWPVYNITNQMKYIRDNLVSGAAYFRTGYVLSNLNGVLDSIHAYYPAPAKLPPLTWLSNNTPDSPDNLQVYKDGKGNLNIKWDAPVKNEDYTYTIYVSDSEPIDTNNAGNILATGLHTNHFSFPASEGDFGYYYAVTALDRYHNESVVCFPIYFSHSLSEQ
jgi:uncharacterized lipoprotein YddW (UPF0748 family)